MDIFGIPIQAFLGQLLLGLVNGSFYAMLSLGLAVIFGLLGIVNFAHGALYMLGAYVAWIGMDRFGINYWAALVVAPESSSGTGYDWPEAPYWWRKTPSMTSARPKVSSRP